MILHHKPVIIVDCDESTITWLGRTFWDGVHYLVLADE